jgi:Uma2 family endonuclease
MSVQVDRWVCTVEDYYRMAEAGILSKEDRVELIDGEIVKMCPIGSAHAGCVNRLNKLLNRKLSELAVIAVQNPIRIDDYSEPQPDIAVLRPRADEYSSAHPTASDVLLVIEVADSSADYDQAVKQPLYARAGVPELLLVRLRDDCFLAFSAPIDGRYQETQRIGRGEAWSSKTIPGFTLCAEDVLG